VESTSEGSPPAAADAVLDRDEALLAALRAGDEAAFVELVQRNHGALVRTAMAYVRDRDVAEEVVQEAWLAVLKGLDRFEGRSSLRTWIFRIVTYQARTRGERERRSVPLSSFDPGPDEPSVDPDRFLGPGQPRAGAWSDPPASWGADASERLLSSEVQAVIAAALETLPDSQRTVITLRDLRGFTSEEVCEALDITPGNQRVLLHRARSRVRAALEAYFRQAEAA
jgi:RNA polymerase sigma-70 factor, ECF subfamily